METVDCGPTVSTAYDYYGKENKHDGRTSEASGLTTRPPNRVRLKHVELAVGSAPWEPPLTGTNVDACWSLSAPG